MRTEIHTRAELEQHLEHNGGLRHVVVQDLDLRGDTDLIVSHPVQGAVFLGCELSHGAVESLTAAGALVFPAVPDLPYEPYRATLYSVEELMAGYRRGDPHSFRDTADQIIYRRFDDLRRSGARMPITEALFQRLHDHAIDNALEDLLQGDEPARVVAIMGGHGMKRTDAAYATVVRISWQLSRRGYLMASGGGPGAMEATHLGAWLANAGEDAIDRALAILSVAPDFRSDGWIDSAYEVREAYADPRPSLGIPTWFYGHEPSNLFATHVAKYFSNSLREDGLLAIAKHGVIYSPGSAGTIQEVFMDATQNHYGTFADVSPMVFLDEAYWTQTKPVYPLLRQLARGRQYDELLGIADDPDEVVAFIENHPPTPYLR